jgi:hypothetical protein
MARYSHYWVIRTLSAEDCGAANVKRKEILHRNWVYIQWDIWAQRHTCIACIFTPIEGVFVNLRPYLRASEISALMRILISEYNLPFIKLLKSLRRTREGVIQGDAFKIQAVSRRRSLLAATKRQNLQYFLKDFYVLLNISQAHNSI